MTIWSVKPLSDVLNQTQIAAEVDYPVKQSWLNGVSATAREKLKLDPDDVTARYPSLIEWCQSLSESDRATCARMAFRQLDTIARAEAILSSRTLHEGNAVVERHVILFTLTQTEKERLVKSRFEDFKKKAESLTLSDFCSNSNQCWDIGNVLTDKIGDKVFINGSMEPSMTALRLIVPGVWYVASPELDAH